jgi:hypothetical protein
MVGQYPDFAVIASVVSIGDAVETRGFSTSTIDPSLEIVDSHGTGYVVDLALQLTADSFEMLLVYCVFIEYTVVV